MKSVRNNPWMVSTLVGFALFGVDRLQFVFKVINQTGSQLVVDTAVNSALIAAVIIAIAIVAFTNFRQTNNRNGK